MADVDVLTAWGLCTDCGYEGMIEYRHLPGESYGDESALGVMLLQRCTLCESSEHALIPLEYYQELVLLARTRGRE
jgi:hypothetical protein